MFTAKKILLTRLSYITIHWNSSARRWHCRDNLAPRSCASPGSTESTPIMCSSGAVYISRAGLARCWRATMACCQWRRRRHRPSPTTISMVSPAPSLSKLLRCAFASKDGSMHQLPTLGNRKQAATTTARDRSVYSPADRPTALRMPKYEQARLLPDARFPRPPSPLSAEVFRPKNGVSTIDD